MYRIVSTSLLLAAGIAVSACNVTTSGVTAPKGGTSFKNGHASDIESEGGLASAVELHAASPLQPGMAAANASSSGSGNSSGGSAGTRSASGSGSRASGGTGGGTGGGASGDSTATSGGREAVATFTMTGPDGASSSTTYYSDGSSSGESSERTVVGGSSSRSADGSKVEELHYSDGTFTRNYYDSDGNKVASEGGDR